MTTSGTRFARLVFRIAAIYGLIALLPQYFLEERLNRDFPPAITHPEHFYGFVGIAIAWQIVFLMIASDAGRYRPLMIPAVLEKLAFGGAVIPLYLQKRVVLPVLAVGMIDLLLATLFAISFLLTRPSTQRAP